jgi:hypothetical protein
LKEEGIKKNPAEQRLFKLCHIKNEMIFLLDCAPLNGIGHFFARN